MQASFAISGDEALETLCAAARAGSPFALLLSDAEMPRMDGFKLAEKIAAEPSLKDLRVILISSVGWRGEAARCREVGIGGYLTKPVRQSELRAAISAVFEPQASAGVGGSPITRHSLREADLKRGVVLVADDNTVNQRVMKGLIERQGHTTRMASNGLDVLRALDEQLFDMIFMDVQMPDMDGLETTAEIRRREQSTGKHQIIIATTAHAMAGDRERCLSAGMDDYLSKPVAVAKLNEMLSRMAPAAEPSIQ
jgi:CheY-like chemotaxis protein